VLAFSAPMSVTIREVARQARVSTATVSRVLNGSGPVAEATRRRVTQAVTELAYEPNAVARSLVSAATHTIGILLPDISNPFFPELVKGVQLLADDRRYTLLLLNTEGDATREASALSTLRGKRVDGVVMVGLTSGPERIGAVLGTEIPVVVLDRAMRPGTYTVVRLDHARGAALAMRHLLALGHEKIAYIGGPRGLELSRERVGAYRAALRGAGIGVDPRLVLRGDFSEVGGSVAVEHLLASGAAFTAIFAANDLSAIGAIRALRTHGLQVPKDVSVIGFDDIHLAGYVTPALTTIRQPTYAMGRRAAELLIDAVEGAGSLTPETVLFEPELVVRESTAPPPDE
jgi:DNA-binding LacI/PurR family transcriptional regulator